MIFLHIIICVSRRARHGDVKLECPVPGCGSKFSAACNLATHRKKMHEEHKSIKREVEELAKNEEVKKVVLFEPSGRAIVQSDLEGETISEQQRSADEEMGQDDSGVVDQGK